MINYYNQNHNKILESDMIGYRQAQFIIDSVIEQDASYLCNWTVRAL